MSIAVNDIVKTTKSVTIFMPNGESFELPVGSMGGVINISGQEARVEFEVHLIRSANAQHVMRGRSFLTEPIALAALERLTPTRSPKRS